MFKTLLGTRVIDAALPRLAASADSPWWNGNRADTVKLAWDNSLAHLKAAFGDDPAQWQWGKAHTLTHGHPLGLQKPLDKIFNVGPFPAPGSHEVPNNQTAPIGPASAICASNQNALCYRNLIRWFYSSLLKRPRKPQRALCARRRRSTAPVPRQKRPRW